jgi:hypothetical protein
MERLVKETRLDRGEDPGNGRVETPGVTRDKYWNFREGVLCVDNKVCWWAHFEQKPEGPTAYQGTRG